jgi:hypothetical protein
MKSLNQDLPAPTTTISTMSLVTFGLKKAKSYHQAQSKITCYLLQTPIVKSIEGGLLLPDL